jgi:HEAT repeat protein
MDQSVTLARHFARLVWLLVREPSNTDEQKATLRAAVTVSKDGPVTLLVRDEVLEANDAPVPIAFSGVPGVAAQMTSHGVKAIEIDASVAPADLLGVARILSGAAVAADGGAMAESKRAELGASTVRFVLRPVPKAGALPDMEFDEVVDEPMPAPADRATTRASMEAHATPRADAGDGGSGLFAQFAAARAPTASADALLALLDQPTTDPDTLLRALEDLVTIAETAAREGKSVLVSDIMFKMGQREPLIQDFDVRRAFVMSLHRLAKAPQLRSVAMQLPHSAAKREELIAILSRAGEDGADVLVEQLATVSAQADRRIYFDALIALQAGVPTLVHMLGDSRWYVARNAADLLGEMQAKEAEQPLTAMLKHEDDRLRRAATGALMRLGTPRAMRAIEEALKSDVPQMRMQAASALVARKDVRNAASLIRALDEEKDDEVQIALLSALGKLATTDAVQRLIKAAESERGLFKKKTTAYRLAALQGLAETATAEARTALEALRQDKEDEIRDAAMAGLKRARR